MKGWPPFMTFNPDTRPPAHWYCAQCRREGRYWAITITVESLEADDTVLGVTQARIGCREIEAVARDYIRLQTGETDVRLHVYGDQLLPDIGGERWRYRWPWRTSRWWLPAAELGVDEYCNPSVTITVPPLGALVVFWRPGPMRTEADGPCPYCEAGTAQWWWAPVSRAIGVLAMPVYIILVALAASAARRRRARRSGGGT